MTNPTPRPALRKAADADVHPAAPRPARSPRTRSTAVTVAPVPEPSPVPVLEDVTVDAVPVAATSPAETVPAPLTPAKKRHAEPGRATKPTKRKFSGSTSDHLRVPEVPEVTSNQRAALDHLFENEHQGKKAKAPKPVDLMGGKVVDLEASVPKNLRKATRDEATRRGLDVDAVVTDLLHAWLTERR
jgi:hypothetical protein